MFALNPQFCGIELTAFLAWGDLPLGLLLGALALLCCSVTGFLLCRIFRRPGLPLICFEHALIGLLLLVSGFAIWQTGGMSVLLPVPLLALGAVLARRTPAMRAKGEWLAGVLGLGAFLLFYAQAFASDAQYLKYPSGDLSYYARLADHLLLSGQENRLLDLATPAVAVAQPYHWGDTWALALLAKTCNIRALYALPLVLFPLLAALFSMGAYRLLKTWAKIPMLPGLIIAPLLLFTPPAGLLPESWIRSFHLLPAPIAQYPKLLIWGIFACALLQRIRDREWVQTAWMLAIAGLFHMPMLPLAALGLMLITIMLWRNAASRRQSWQAEILLLLLLAWPALLYFVWSGPLPFYTTEGAGPGGFRLHLGLALPVLANLAMLWPFALLLIAVRAIVGRYSPEAQRVLSGIAVSLLAGVLAWAFAADLMADAPQFFTALIPLAAIAILLVCITALNSTKRVAAAALCALFPLAGLLVNHSFSKDTYLTDRISQSDYRRLQTIPAISRPWDSLRAVVIKSPLEPDRIATRASVIFYPLELLAFEHPHYTVASLQAATLANVPPGARNADEQARLKWHTPLLQFAHGNGLSAVPPEMQVFWYIKKKHPDILIIANDASVPNELEGFLGEDSVQLESKRYRVLSLYYGR